jgi:hypothetical protein
MLLEPAATGVSGLQRDCRRSLIALGVLVTLVLFIACANIANLMTAQGIARARNGFAYLCLRREMAFCSTGLGGKRLGRAVRLVVRAVRRQPDQSAR